MTSLLEPVPGLVISYSYLWKSQAIAGEVSKRKDRPCAIVVATRDQDGDTIVYVVPITHSAPTKTEDAIEILAGVKKRIGLDGERSWIVVSEMNCFTWPGVDLRPRSRQELDRFDYGFLPVDLFDRMKRAIISRRKAGALKIVKREL